MYDSQLRSRPGFPSRRPEMHRAVLVAFTLLMIPRAHAQSEPTAEVAAGHSYHGEAFNEGPRQAAVLMDGLPKIEFETSAEDERTQQFIEQGIAQLHGFWYLEAERSFREAARIEPDLAIAYWGMAMANVNNQERARGLIAAAMERVEEHASRRERLYIEAWHRALGTPKLNSEDDGDASANPRPETDTPEDKEETAKRFRRLCSDLEAILHEFPDDVEAKALLAVVMWQAERDVAITSRYAVSALLDDLFAQRPLHPAHHYKIHLWDRARPEHALESAAKCGPASPAIAHMWHMPGHIYSRLHRYADAAWQQEASARVDHAHMAHARLMPDQIHNFAHNNEWWIRNLLHVGRVHEAIDQARNLVSLPRHPKYNSAEERGSFKYGHQRLLQCLTTYRLWPELLDETQGPYLPQTGNPALDQEREAWIAVATAMAGRSDAADAVGRLLQRKSLELQLERLDLADRRAALTEDAKSASSATEDVDAKSAKEDDADAEEDDADAEEEFTKRDDELQQDIERLDRLVARISAATAAVRGDAKAVREHADKAKLDPLLRVRWLARAGDIGGALERVRSEVQSRPGEVPPLAILVDLLWKSGEKQKAAERFAELRRLASQADLDAPLLDCLTPIAEFAEVTGDWRIEPEPATDLGDRPPLDTLGPSRWRPYASPPWEALAADGEPVADDRFAGRPRIVIFYLGAGCLHCVEQLHEFGPRAAEFRDAGIELIGISTETVELLNRGLDDFDGTVAIPLFADPDHQAFHDYRCWDDFEDQPLHGTFLIDSANRVRWQDISYEPFMDVDFLLDEAQRLLKLPGPEGLESTERR